MVAEVVIIGACGLAAGGGFVFFRAWRVNQSTSLQGAIAWAFLAWVSWFAVALTHLDDAVMISLALTGCAGVAVLGARRPHVGAWHFVVLGLLAVVLWPSLEALVINVRSFNLERRIFLLGIVAVTVGNYFPTRYAPAATTLAIACVGAWWAESGSIQERTSLLVDRRVIALIALATPLVALVSPVRRPANAFDADWLSFRDRFGFVWAARVRDQFQRAASNASLDVSLGMSGLRGDRFDSATIDQSRRILASLTRRFLDTGENSPESHV